MCFNNQNTSKMFLKYYGTLYPRVNLYSPQRYINIRDRPEYFDIVPRPFDIFDRCWHSGKQ